MTAFVFVSTAEADVAAKVGFVVRDTGQEQPGAGVQRTWLREANGKLVPSHSSPDSPANLSLFRLAVGVEGAR